MVMELQRQFGMKLVKELLEMLDEELYKGRPAGWVCEGKRGYTRYKVTRKIFVPVDERAGFGPAQRVSEGQAGGGGGLPCETGTRQVD